MQGIMPRGIVDAEPVTEPVAAAGRRDQRRRKNPAKPLGVNRLMKTAPRVQTAPRTSLTWPWSVSAVKTVELVPSVIWASRDRRVAECRPLVDHRQVEWSACRRPSFAGPTACCPS